MTYIDKLLDNLESETEMLLALLKDRQLGLMTWNSFISERLKNINKIRKKLGIK